MLDHCPVGPDWKLDWSALRRRYDWVEALHGCDQDPSYHAEGDVGIHTRMACEELVASPVFRALPAGDRAIAFAAVLMHDVSKPECSKEEGGRITSRGHSARGERRARTILWSEGVPFESREAVCGLIRHHQVPFFALDRDDVTKLVYRISQSTRSDLLALVAWADGVGRRCADPSDQQRIVDNVELFRDYCREHECLRGPRQFASDHSRFLYFQRDDRDPSYHAHDDTRCEVTLMSGLPAAGKSQWVLDHGRELGLVSLDGIRTELGIDPGSSQGRVLDAARGRAKEFLRAQRSFVWNATNLSPSIRQGLIELFSGYRARIRIVYLETGPDELRARNRARSNPVPEAVMRKMMQRWTVPTRAEAHRVDVVLT